MRSWKGTGIWGGKLRELQKKNMKAGKRIAFSKTSKR